MKSEEQRIKMEGGVLWFIEHTKTGRWFYHSFEPKENLPCTCRKCYPGGYPFKITKDGWTSDPIEAQGYLTKEAAELAAFGEFVTDEPIENILITEHYFNEKDQ